MNTTRVPRREEIPVEYTWDLTPLFPDDQAWTGELEKLREYPSKLKAFEGHLADSSQSLLDFLRLSDEISVRLEALSTYAHCKHDQDISNSVYLDMYSKAQAVFVDISTAASFFSSELVGLKDDVLDNFYLVCPELETYRRYLYSIRRLKDHTLSSREEALLSASMDLLKAPSQINSVFHNADLKYPDVTGPNNELLPLTAQTFVPYLQNSDRDFRYRVFTTFYNRLGEFRHTIAQSLDSQFRSLKFYSSARGYSTTLESALDGNEIPVSVYFSLIEAVHAHLEPMYAYVDLSRRMLGLEQLHHYDIYTPLLPSADRIISYDEAKNTVLSALSVLGNDYLSILRQGFDERWIDRYENEGKRSGAYSTGSGRPHPYVLLNHKDTLDCMFTIAHEMGHALHSVYSTAAQPVCNSDYVIFVAEVASTCNEILLTKYLLDHTDDATEKAYLINHFLNQFRTTLFRQTMFAEFELFMGRTAESGSALTADLLTEQYLELNKLYYGPHMVPDTEIALEWARIPHFFYNYYVYQYATGFSAAVAIANRILTVGESAVADYKLFLSGGCSTDPISLLKIAGVDMSTPAPVSSALSLFSDLVKELDTLLCQIRI